MHRLSPGIEEHGREADSANEDQKECHEPKNLSAAVGMAAAAPDPNSTKSRSLSMLERQLVTTDDNEEYQGLRPRAFGRHHAQDARQAEHAGRRRRVLRGRHLGRVHGAGAAARRWAWA